MLKLRQVNIFIALALACFLGVFQAGWAKDEIPGNLTDRDVGNVLPVALFKGRVSNQPTRYVLGPEDEVSLKIKDLEKFDQKFVIRPDGYATIHPFGEVYLAGTDIQGLQTWLQEKFKFYLVKPEVTANVTRMRAAVVYITGAVRRAGTYQFIREDLNNTVSSNPALERVEIVLSNVLTKAGGVTEHADIDNISIVHASTGQKEVFSLRKLLAGEASEIWLLPGDTVIVPELNHPMDPETFKLISRSNFYRDKFPVVVLGAVKQQGEIHVDPGNNSVQAALALAGGYIEKVSDTDKILVQRPSENGGFNRFFLNPRKMQFALQPGDVVFVTHAKLATVERGLQILIGITQPYFYGVSATNSLKTLIDPVNRFP